MKPRLLVVQHEPDTGPGWWGDWLAEAGLDLVVRHPYVGDELGAAPTYDGVLALGGAMGPVDDDSCPWLPATRALLADAVDANVPVFGICLGAELLTVACGGEVRRGAAGPELGVLDIELSAAGLDDEVLSALPPRARVLQWHWEELTTLPSGAVPLATSAAYRHQAFRLGRAWAVQGHPEVTPSIARSWASADSPLLAAAGRSGSDLVSEVEAAAGVLARTWRPVAEAFAAVVRGGSAG